MFLFIHYMQGLNTTAVHAHGALYGVYGTLGLGLMLFCLRAMNPELKWKERPIWFGFWAINISLMLEIVLSLLPVGLMQTYQSFRSATGRRGVPNSCRQI
ncbi:MAG: hypothetical protein ACR2G5_08250 [Pyrinomonadaceae bacterium]